MNPLCFPDGLERLWAKSPHRAGAPATTLVEHTWEVLERLHELALLRPGLPERTAQRRLWHLLFWAVFLHDWGKAARGFQRVLRGKERRWPYRHEVLSLAFVNWVAADLTPRELLFLVAAVATHHKDYDELQDYLDPFDEESDPLPEMLKEVDEKSARALYHWLSTCGQPWIEQLGMDALGVQMPALPPSADEAVVRLAPSAIRQCLRLLDQSMRRWEEEPPPAEDLRPGVILRGLMLQADHLASSGWGKLPPPRWEKETILQAIGIREHRLYQHQHEASRVLGHALLFAPTGRGKTEAALLWAVNQRAPRLFYTLPYQASMNAMFDRLRPIFSEQVGLLHGHSAMALFRRLMEQNYTAEEAFTLARALHNRSALPYYPVRVFSPYQMLKAAFQLKGFEALLSDFCEAAFIFDEIHAYEPTRLAMIIQTMAYLARHYGARFLVMSATLPTHIRRQLEEALSPLTALAASPQMVSRLRRHRLFLQDGDLLDEANLRAMKEFTLQGHQTLIVCNTVRRAQQAWLWMREHLPPEIPLFLLHGRFTGRDRAQKEQHMLQAAGLAQQSRHPLVVVATQVVEVSLNLDLDGLFTDPAPLEALLQRFGRVNRMGKRPRAPVFVFRHIDDSFRRIYRPPEQILYTLEVLETEAQKASSRGIPIDEGRLPAWLDATYSGVVLDAWQKEFQRSAQEFQHIFLDSLQPFRSNQTLAAQFDRLFDGTEVLPESLYDEYLALRDSERALEADSLLVPLSWGFYAMLAQRHAIIEGERGFPPIVRIPYSEDLGLDLEAQPLTEKDQEE